jgi:hypothetical protein
MVCLLLFAVIAKADGPPSGYRTFKWGAAPGATLKKMMGPTDEGISMYVPLKGKSVGPLFDLPVAEEDYSFSHGKFFQGEAYLDGADMLQKMKTILIEKFGKPTFVNENLKVWKWKWPVGSIEVDLTYQASFSRTTVRFANNAI